MYASRKIPVVFYCSQARITFPFSAGPPLTGYLIVSANTYQKKNITINGVEQQKPKKFENWKRDQLVSRSNQRVVSSLFARKLDHRTPSYRRKVDSV